MYYHFVTSLLQGPPKGMGKDISRLVRKVIFDVPREENIHWGIFLYKPRFASISRAIEAILHCCPLITWIEIRGCFPGGLETAIVSKFSQACKKIEDQFTAIYYTNPCCTFSFDCVGLTSGLHS